MQKQWLLEEGQFQIAPTRFFLALMQMPDEVLEEACTVLIGTPHVAEKVRACRQEIEMIRTLMKGLTPHG